MSDKKLDNKIYKNLVFEEKKSLPSWEEFHTKENFILEACFFDGDRSITIRNIGNSFVVIDKNLSDFSNITKQSFITNGYGKIEISQIWEEKEDEFCQDLKVLKPTLALFTGFSKGDKK